MAEYGPILYSDPWARFTMFMMPSTSVRPAASRKSITPSCTPFSSCSKKSSKVIKKGRGRPAPLLPGDGPPSPLHLAVLMVGVLVLLEHLFLDLHLHALGAALDRLEQVERLDGMLVVVERERPPHRIEVR